MRKFKISDRFTIADIGLEIEGDSLNELFWAGAEGMFAIILGKAPEGARAVTRDINLPADRKDQLLVDWLSELLYLFDTEGLVPVAGRLVVGEEDGFMLSGTVDFRIYNRENEVAEHEIKAVTYYKLQIKEKDGRYQCHVVFDL